MKIESEEKNHLKWKSLLPWDYKVESGECEFTTYAEKRRYQIENYGLNCSFGFLLRKKIIFQDKLPSGEIIYRQSMAGDLSILFHASAEGTDGLGK